MFSPAELNRFRDALVAEVYRASSLQVTDSIRHLHPLINGAAVDPALSAKRLVVADVVVIQSSGDGAAPFQFPGAPVMVLGEPRNKSVLRQKLERGGLGEEQFEDLSEKERAAEAHLMEIAHRRPEESLKLLRQLESMVLGECREAYFRASEPENAFGRAMLIDVQDRLRRLAAERPHMVGNQEYECLMGMAGLLTSVGSLYSVAVSL